MENLLVGSSGSDAIKLQQRLKEFGFYLAAIDGIFSNKTEAAVKAFQDSEGLAADGIVGFSTQEALDLNN
ncbi:peptidoglycan-binding domain-containing protein [Argonema antarcticum]|uniref:peptidoglycan-binding domain-containing protein n=1 Tax=Argonema antarcticum TaxID=2942763 RepID=UPI002012F3B4|nr:peptidoglycan-binding domain-containing protein [Argonema antarcticum]MCL1473477.1 peptidoglycan-binding protein [Argonema antarcticum A004/B2]